jgi:hypothetical protein
MEGATQREGEAPVVSGGDVGAGPLIDDPLDTARLAPVLPSSPSLVAGAPPSSPLAGDGEAKPPPKKKRRRNTKSGVCRCKDGDCKRCACAKAGRKCTAACHGGNENSSCTNRDAIWFTCMITLQHGHQPPMHVALLIIPCHVVVATLTDSQ